MRIADWFQPDLVVADYHARNGQTGLEAAEALRGENPDVRLVFITPEAEARLQEGAGHLQPFRVVSHPWEYHDLMGAVEAALD